ncbi:hypothetical protein [Streptomyces avicenniae]|uniref:hypothetical protein n=1 Tax=Streptomyces avicenniae TaxID=500153 RepID=UPI00069946E2|nr:hypothetical protein [Streptomyces avicenniae]
MPLETVLFDEEFTLAPLAWGEGEEPEVAFAGAVYGDNAFSRMVRHFDAIDLSYAMSFVVQPDRADWRMMLLGDHWVESDHSRVTCLEDYLRYVVATGGLVSARRALFSEYRGDLREPLRYDAALAAVAAGAPSDG